MKTVHFHNYEKLAACSKALVEKLTFEHSSLLQYAGLLTGSYQRYGVFYCLHLQGFKF